MSAIYLDLDSKVWREKLDALAGRERPCEICPRDCRVDRRDERGLCRAPAGLVTSSANLHFGEEPPISGQRGSGTIFLTHCNLYCLFCQNYPISQLGNGRPIGERELARSMLELQGRGAHNINFVSPTHYTAPLIRAVHEAAGAGLNIPIVWNSNAYERVETLRLLDGIVDIYMPDIKYSRDADAEDLSRAPGYWDISRRAVSEMQRQVGILRLNESGVATRGLLVRHLVLPNDRSGTRAVLRFLAEELSPETYVSLLAQYFPAHRAPHTKGIDRRITREEYSRALGWLGEFGLENGYTQESPIRFC